MHCFKLLVCTSDEVGEAGGRDPGDVLDVVDGPRVVIGRDGLGQQCEHIAVVGGNTGGDGCLDPRMGIYVAVLDWLAADGGDDTCAAATDNAIPRIDRLIIASRFSS